MAKMLAFLLVLSLVALSVYSATVPSTSALSVEYRPLYQQLLKTSDLQAQEGGDLLATNTAARFNIFIGNVQFILKENLNTENTYKLEINKFALLSNEEFQKSYFGLLPEDNKIFSEEIAASSEIISQPTRNLQTIRAITPTFSASDFKLRPPIILLPINWTARGKVTSVKNQGACGSCWAFAAAAATQSAYLIELSLSSDLSTQQLVDCSGAYGNYGCGGGWQFRAFNYIKAKKITTNAVYPYTAKTGTTCKYNGVGLSIAGHKNATNTISNCAPLRTALWGRPQAVALDASGWSFYSSGVFNNCPSSTVNHAVLLTGLDFSSNWYIKNSWGSSWGVNGYITLKKDNCRNICKYPGSAPYL